MSIAKDYSWKHAALILSKKLGAGSAKANDELRKMLNSFRSIDAIYDNFFQMIPVADNIQDQLNKTYSKLDFDFKVTTILDSNYPEKLKHIYGAPPILYYRGDNSLFHLKKTIAFVGTRELTDPNHITHSTQVVERLVAAGYEAIVSGLAMGSDTVGHESAIRAGGKTIAVLGTPLNNFYPKENRNLQNKIAQDHLLLSEYPIGLRSFGSYFANRNLTTTGLSSEGIVVARASDKSGTQHAIRHCLEQKKQLYALDNNIKEPDYNWIIKYKNQLKVIK